MRSGVKILQLKEQVALNCTLSAIHVGRLTNHPVSKSCWNNVVPGIARLWDADASDDTTAYCSRDADINYVCAAPYLS